MITNCLDVERNTWDAAYTGDSNWSNWGNLTPSSGEGNKELGYANTAQNCHRYYDLNNDGNGTDAGEEDGWNSVTPW